MDTDSLRARTREEHEAVEALLPVMSPDLTPAQYADVLRCFYRALRPWEDWAALHAPPRFAALAADRRRSALLEADLDHWGSEPPATDDAETLTAVFGEGPTNEAAFLGAMYVVEGSTLGGQYIARHVEERFNLQPGQGDAYFRGYGEATGAKWREFKDLLVALPNEEAEVAIAAAKAMFGHFGRALQPCAAVSAGEPLPA